MKQTMLSVVSLVCLASAAMADPIEMVSIALEQKKGSRTYVVRAYANERRFTASFVEKLCQLEGSVVETSARIGKAGGEGDLWRVQVDESLSQPPCLRMVRIDYLTSSGNKLARYALDFGSKKPDAKYLRRLASLVGQTDARGRNLKKPRSGFEEVNGEWFIWVYYPGE